MTGVMMGERIKSNYEKVENYILVNCKPRSQITPTTLGVAMGLRGSQGGPFAFCTKHKLRQLTLASAISKSFKPET